MDIVRDALQKGVIGNIQRGHNQQLVLRKVSRRRKDEVRTHIRFVQSLVQLLQRGAISPGSPGPVRIRHESDPVVRVRAIQNRNIIADLHIHQLRADLLQLVRHPAHLGVSAVRFKVVAQHPLPVGLLSCMDRVPVPVLHHVRAT